MDKALGVRIKVIAQTQSINMEDKKPDNVADNPALLPYGSNVGAPAIVVNDIQFWKSPRIIHVNQQFEDKDVIIFRFKDYGFINDNRFSTRELSIGAAGITLLITKTTEK